MEGLVAEAAAPFAGQRVLITGAAGFIGRHLTQALISAGAVVSVLESPAADLAPIQPWQSQLACFSVDIRDATAVQQAVYQCRPATVFHLAAVGVTNPFLDLDLALEVNLRGAVHLFRACFADFPAGDHPARLVHTGTPYEYGGQRGEPDPINPYAASKAAAFAIARMFHRTRGWPIVTVRPYQVYGPGQPAQALIPAAIRAALAGEPLRMTGGEQQRDFVFVDDVVRGYLLAALHGVDGRSYDLGWGQSHTLRAVADRLHNMMQVDCRPDYGALPYRPGEIWHMEADQVAAAEDLGWSPQVNLEQGLTITIRSIRLDNSH